MDRYEFKLPDIGEGVTEGEIVSWLVGVGDSLAEDQEMVEVMTDKATVTIGAPKAGRVVELGGGEGDIVPVGSVLIVLDVAGSGAAVAPSAPKPRTPSGNGAAAPEKKDEGPAATAVGDIKESLPGMGIPRPPKAPEISVQDSAGYFAEKPLAAPATRKYAREIGVDLRQVPPTGPAGRVTREDVEHFASGAVAAAPQSSSSVDQSAVTLRPAPKPGGQAPARRPPPRAPTGAEERIPIRGMRRRIYENMSRSMHTAAHFTYVDECDVTALRALRARTKAIAERDGIKLSFLPFIIKAVVAALKQHPTLNSLVDDEKQEIVLKGSYDIGIAAATDAGLIVPVLRDRRSN